MKRFLSDIGLWIVAAAICLVWRLSAEKDVIWEYILQFGILMVLWLGIGMLLRLYRSYKTTPLWQALLSLGGTVASMLIISLIVFPLWMPLSVTPSVWVISVVAV